MYSFQKPVLTLILLAAASLGAQAPTADPKPAPPAPKAAAKPGTKASKATTTPKDDASVTPEVASIAKARSQTLKAKKKVESAPLPPPVNLNKATKEELMKLPGITAEYADKLIAHRPYSTKSRAVLSGAIPYAIYLPIKKRISVS